MCYLFIFLFYIIFYKQKQTKTQSKCNIKMLHRLIPYKYKKWSTLVGGVLIHLALGSFYTFGNMSPYLTSYLREYDGIDVRYSQSIWIYTALGISLSSSTIICGILNSNLGVNTRLLVFLGCVLMRLV